MSKQQAGRTVTKAQALDVVERLRAGQVSLLDAARGLGVGYEVALRACVELIGHEELQKILLGQVMTGHKRGPRCGGSRIPGTRNGRAVLFCRCGHYEDVVPRRPTESERESSPDSGRIDFEP
jgi:hypothetical protein